MLKAIQKVDNQEIVILDPQWKGIDKLNKLRQLDQQDLLVCHECRQPVRVRAGDERQWHFAHKQRQNCVLQSESLVLIQARAALYRQLVEKFGIDQVELEKQMGGLPRPVDCHVRGKKGVIVYWICDGGINPQIRDAIEQRFSQPDIQHIHWLFTALTLREQDKPGHFTLTTTERAVMLHTAYDNIYGLRYGKGQTLHYLNGANLELVTLRSLQRTHATQTFKGKKLVTPLSNIQILRQSGGFVHPGEHELWERYESERKALEAQLPQISQPESAAPFSSMASSWRQRYVQQKEESPVPSSSLKVGTCIFCGKETTDHWYYEGATKECKCRACRSLGRE